MLADNINSIQNLVISVHVLQMFCVIGWQRSLLVQLISLPLGYFSNRDLMAILMPTLIAICYQNPMAVDLIKPLLSTKTFAIYLEVSFRFQPTKY